MGEFAKSTHRQGFPVSPRANPDAIVGGDDGSKYRFTVLADGLLRFEWADDGQFEDRASTFAIRRLMPVPKFRVLDNEGILEIITSRFRVEYDRRPFSPSGLSVQVLGNVSSYHSQWRYGQEVGDLGGTARTLDNVDGRCPLGPGVVSRRGFAVIDDSTSMLFESNGWVGVRRPGHRIDGYVFAYGLDYRASVRALYDISGNQPLLPRWALGNWWSRYHKYAADEYLQLMDHFRAENVPLAVGVLDMDWHHVDIDAKYGSGWTGYSWNKKLIPNPTKFLSQLHERDLKVSLNVHPAEGVRGYEDIYQEMAKYLGHDIKDDDPIFFDVTDRRFFDAYFDVLHRSLEKQGVNFWWIDWQQGPYSRISGIDPLWMLNHFHFLDNGRDQNRPLTFSRYAGPGSQRYPVGFSGDTVISWESLEFQPEFTATASNIGFGWWSHDIGGHMNGRKDDELATRWVQLGVFSPILRLHSSDNPFNTKEPWKFGAEACKAMISALQLRHRLMPYLYSMNVKSADNGLPLVQPMYWEYPKEKTVYRYNNQFLFGTQLIVVPITSPRDRETRHARSSGWLPPGRWVDIFTEAVYDGSRELQFHRTLDKYPVFAREGAIIPLDGDAILKNGGFNPTHIELVVIVGADGHFDLLEDNGTGSKLADADIVSTAITYTQESGILTINPASGPIQGVIKRTWTLRFPAISPDFQYPTFNVSGHEFGFLKLDSQSAPAYLLSDVPTNATIVVELGPHPQLAPTDVLTHLYPIVEEAQIEFWQKKAVWNVLTDVMGGEKGVGVGKNVRISRLISLNLSEAMLGVVLEYVLADGRWEV